MGYYTTAEIVKIVNKLIDRCGTRDPYKVAKELGINVIYRNFDKQRGAYKVILKNRFIGNSFIVMNMLSLSVRISSNNPCMLFSSSHNAPELEQSSSIILFVASYFLSAFYSITKINLIPQRRVFYDTHFNS